MKRLALILVVLLTTSASAVADEREEIIKLKLKGYLPGIELKELHPDAQPLQLQLENYKDQLDPEHLKCGHPDFPDADVAAAPVKLLQDVTGYTESYCKTIKLMHSRALEATGQGSWGLCVPELYPKNHAVKYYVDTSNIPSYYSRKVTDVEVDRLASAGVWGTRGQIATRFMGKTYLDLCKKIGIEETYRRVGNAHVETKDRSEAGIIVRFRYIAGGVVGVGWFPNGGCGDQVEFHIDTSYTPDDVQDMIDLWAHECGHCNKLPHTFSGQDSHRGVMSYRSWQYYYGFSRGPPEFEVPKDPSWPQLTRQYGGEEVPLDEDPTEPPPPPPPPGDDGDFVLKAGEELVLMRANGQRVTLLVKETSGPDFTTQLKAALDKVPDYPSRSTHRAMLGTIYDGTARAIASGDVKPVDAVKSLSVLRGFLLAGDSDKWNPFFAVADQATTGQHFEAIASVLSSGQMYVLSKEEHKQLVRVIVFNLHGQKAEEFLTPEMIAVIKTIVEYLPPSEFKNIIMMVLTLMEVLGGAKAEKAEAKKSKPRAEKTESEEPAIVEPPPKTPVQNSAIEQEILHRIGEMRKQVQEISEKADEVQRISREPNDWVKRWEDIAG